MRRKRRSLAGAIAFDGLLILSARLFFVPPGSSLVPPASWRGAKADKAICAGTTATAVLLQPPAEATEATQAIETTQAWSATWLSGDAQVFLVIAVLLLVAVATGVADPYSKSGADHGVSRAGGFRYFVDRCENNFNSAFYALAAQRPDFESTETVFTYYDGYVARERPELALKCLPRLDAWSRQVELISRDVTNDFDNKRIFASKLQETGCEGAFAPSFMTAEAAMRATTEHSDALFFIKLAVESGGEGMRIVPREQLEAVEITNRHVVQLAVQDIELVEGRKFTVRFYLLIQNKEVRLHRRGLVVLHGSPYAMGSVAYDVQVCNDALHDSANSASCQLRPLHDLPRGDAWHASIAQRIREICPALQDLLDASTTERYTIIGGDALIERGGDAKLIELNFYPNLGSHNAAINTEVKQPMLQDMISRILTGNEPAELELLYGRNPTEASQR